MLAQLHDACPGQHRPLLGRVLKLLFVVWILRVARLGALANHVALMLGGGGQYMQRQPVGPRHVGNGELEALARSSTA
jgi:hypothetical protein